MHSGGWCVSTLIVIIFVLLRWYADKWGSLPEVSSYVVSSMSEILQVYVVICIQVYIIYHADPHAARRDISLYSDSPVILNDIDCTGSEAQLTQCTRNGYGNFSSECTGIAVALCEG